MFLQCNKYVKKSFKIKVDEESSAFMSREKEIENQLGLEVGRWE